MKHIQVIDRTDDCPYNIYAVDEEIFDDVFEDGTTVQFFEDLFNRHNAEHVAEILRRVEAGLTDRKHIDGIHGLLFFGLIDRKIFFPTMRYDDVGNGI